MGLVSAGRMPSWPKTSKEMALKHAQMKAIETNQHGAVQAQESGAQMAVERGAFVHTDVELRRHMTASRALRIPIDEASARAIAAARRAKKKQRLGPMPPIEQ